MRRVSRAMLVTLGLIAFFAEREARACGGVFPRTTTTTADGGAESLEVAGEHWVVALSPTRTVLWVRFDYKGSPSGFAWIIPVKRVPRVELSRDAWFDSLEKVTAPTATAPNLRCQQTTVAGGGAGGSAAGGGCSCLPGAGSGAPGGADGGSSRGSGIDAGSDPVELLARQSAGAYEAVTVRSTDATALERWLVAEGYALPEHVRPAIAAYTAEGYDFLALKLQPGASVTAMAPVRLTFEGESGVLPTRMAAAGIGGALRATLHVIAEQPYRIAQLPQASLALGEVTWDYATGRSNLRDVRERSFDGRPASFLLTAKVPTLATVAAEYARATGRCGNATSSLVVGDGRVGRVCDGDAGADAGADDGGAPSSVPCRPPLGIDVAELECGDATDLASALAGMRPSAVWLTRLDLRVDRASLTDLTLEAAPPAVAVSPVVRAARWVNPPCADPYAIDGAGAAGLVFLFGLRRATRRRR